jgi:hypothetical protein
MKKTVLLFAMMVFAAAAVAQTVDNDTTTLSNRDISEWWFNDPYVYLPQSTVKVGIGTSSPTHKLDVRGTIRANEVLVNIPNGADFVFDNNYHLMPLDELSEYVQQNKHLPEVESAAEMEQDGVTMGEMQIKLLQKIEELTLYIIQQEQRIKDLESKLKNSNML